MRLRVSRRVCVGIVGDIFIGHSESLAGVDHNLEYVRPALYRTGGKGVEWHRK